MFVVQALRRAGVAGLAYSVTKEVLVPVVVRYLARRRARIEDAKDDLAVLNSHAVFFTDLAEFPETIPMATRKGIVPVADNTVERVLRNNHKRFCAKWARAAKARFEFARICDDSAINRAAVHRWLYAQWKGLVNSQGNPMPPHVMDLFMTDTIDMCFLVTAELAQSESKRSVRRRARMEYYNERKFVEGWK